jgi:hypothetical protein
MLSDRDKGAETHDGCGGESHCGDNCRTSMTALQIDREITFTRELFVARRYRKSLSDEAQSLL